jgi:uncharacterized protein YdhG (YjbR/CyaY superfamily)
MQRTATSVQSYIASVKGEQLAILEQLRELVLDAVPEAEEKIRWGMLCYDDDGALFALAAQKNYVSLYVMATQALKGMAEELSAIDHGKGCLRFKKDSGVPTETIRRLLLHAKSIRERECKQLP